ncbi:MAG: peptide chain release factor-like protein [Sandaracinaceae bacterium]
MTRPRTLLTVSTGLGPVDMRPLLPRLAAALASELAVRGCAVVGTVHEEELRSAALLVEGGVPADLLGTHAVVARSPRRGRHARKRWFFGVTSAPFDTQPVALKPEDVRYQTCRAGGAGGQHVNKTDSAVIAVHVPSGLRARVSSERSQHQNRRLARALLEHKWVRLAASKKADRDRAARRRRLQVERGSPVRVWRLEGGRLG